MKKQIVSLLALVWTQVACFDPVALINDYVFAGAEMDDCEALASVFGYTGTFFPNSPAELGHEFDDFSLDVPSGNRIHGWLIHAPKGSALGTVLLSNSVVGTRACFLPWADLLVRAGYQVVMYDYEGFGDSGGSKSVLNIVPDARVVLQWTLDSDDPARQAVILMGVSLGSGPSITLAAEFEESVQAVILDSTYLVPRLEDLGVRGLAATFVPDLLEAFPDELDNELNIASVAAPVLMLHGALDFSFPIERIRALFARAPNGVELIEFANSGHATAIFDDSERFESAVLNFLKGVLRPPSP